MIDKKKLQLEQLDHKLRALGAFEKAAPQSIGWIRTIRLSLGMSLQQLANRLDITRQSARDMELREMEGGLTLGRLRDAANAMDMKLIYALVPKDGSLDALIERKARELAIRIVTRTSNNMRLEDQENSKERIQHAIEERAAVLKKEVPRMLWD